MKSKHSTNLFKTNEKCRICEFGWSGSWSTTKLADGQLADKIGRQRQLADKIGRQGQLAEGQLVDKIGRQ